MIFYFIVYVIIGITASSAYTIHQMRTQGSVGALPKWAWPNNPIANWMVMACGFAPILAVVTSLIQSGLWAFATAGEIFLGYILTSLAIPFGGKLLIVLISPISLVSIFGALWGFWYIG
jgi:hypothetical protein|tara:strand:- start:150 stop:506 length:357 start_codon:yes stop_codon:yes gene_type:complete